MNICFRVDGSTKIGTGHIMRCLTLAEELKQNGHIVTFICRLHDGHLCHLISDKGFKVFKLSKPTKKNPIANELKHASWLGVPLKQDVRDTIDIIQTNQIQFDWIIIDHYAIDETWEKEIRKYIPKIMVIDDIADRKHVCDILLDQNYYENANNRYINLVPKTCILLLGPKFALIREEFVKLRNLPKPQNIQKTLLVFYGGSDPTNETLNTIEAIKQIKNIHFTTHVVVGPSNPNVDLIKRHCDQDNLIFHYNINYMAQLLFEVDFAICAGGSITWERYCLGTPAILTAIADNQINLCKNVNQLGIDHYLGVADMVTQQAIKNKAISFLEKSDTNLLGDKAKKLVDGIGKKRVINTLFTIK